MTLPLYKSTVLLLLSILLTTSLARVGPVTSVPSQLTPGPSTPLQSDDGLDPVTLIFTGYAPSWWVAANIAGWSDSAYCSGPKTINNNTYNYTLEHPDPLGLPCYGPRDHVRIWDMGYSPVFGTWSIGSAHHEHTVCIPYPCHHVIDSWARAKADVGSAFLNGAATVSISNYTLPNAGYYQGIFNSGNSTMVKLKPPLGQYPVVFNENGLTNQTSWSVTLNGTTTSSQKPDMIFNEPDGTYTFTTGAPQGFNASPSSGSVTVRGAAKTQNILFRTPWATSMVWVDSASQHVQIGFNSNATVLASTVRFSKAGDTSLSFNVTEFGPAGVVNVTLPRSILPTGASGRVYLDGVSDPNVQTNISADDFHIYITTLYGTHTVEIQFASPGMPLLDYVAGGALAVTIVTSLAVVFRFKMKRRKDLPSDSTST